MNRSIKSIKMEKLCAAKWDSIDFIWKTVSKFICVIVFLLCFDNMSYSQGICIDSTGALPNGSALLDLSSTTRGLLIPRMTTVQMNAIATPDTSLMIFNTDNNCIYYYTGPPLAAWQPLYCACASAPATPGLITGLQVVCQGSSLVYSIAAVANASSYSWGVPAGSVITAGQGTTSITVTIGANPGNISVSATNNCGASPNDTLALTISLQHGTLTFNYTDGLQSWTVPPCVTIVTITADGAQGGTGGYHNNPVLDGGGNGGSVVGTLTVVGGTVLNIYVGGQGFYGVMAIPGQGGYNGGGNGFYIHSSFSGAGGGGASDVRVGGIALANRVVVAGGGGGGGCLHTTGNYEKGGPGGAAIAGAGFANNIQGGAGSGGGGTGGSGGTGGVGTCTAGSGVLGIGGSGCATAKNAGGGGGGYYGGGAGYNCGGGGGSNYTGGLTTVTTNTQGAWAGNGKVIINW